MMGNGSANVRSSDARGHYTIGKELVDSVIDRIRRVAGSQKYGFSIWCGFADIY